MLVPFCINKTPNLHYNSLCPENPNEKRVQSRSTKRIGRASTISNASLADLYDPNTMPPVLVKAHQALDKAVDRPQPLVNETKRIEFLFELYDKYTGGMIGERRKGKKNK